VSHFYVIHSGSRAYLAPYPIGGGYSPVVIWLRCEADHSPPSGAEVKKYMDLYIYSLIHLHALVKQKDSFALLCKNYNCKLLYIGKIHQRTAHSFFFNLWVLHPVAHLSDWFFMTPSIATKFQYVNSQATKRGGPPRPP
jgi:hypothetical protein